MSRRCRHQLADLAHGSLDADGCLVCPWHGSRYDVRNAVAVTLTVSTILAIAVRWRFLSKHFQGLPAA